MNKIFMVILVMIFLMGGILCVAGTAQEIDPFYLQRLNRGESAFAEGNYETAIEELEIALFGIQEDKQLKAKAYVYLGMSHFYLNNNEKARAFLKDAKDILGLDGLRALITDESVWFFLNRSMIELNLLESEKKQPADTVIPPKKPAITKARSTNAIMRERDLEQQIKDNPKNAGLYYDLYEHHMANDNEKAAHKTITNLIKRNPDEVKGYFLLGRMEYRKRNLKAAAKNLNKVFVLQNKVTVEEYLLLEAKIYQILTVLLRGERQRAYRMYAEWSALLTEDKIRYLDIEEQDRGIFQGIVESEAAQAEMEKLESQEENLREGSEPEQKRREEQGEVQREDLNAERAGNTEIVENLVPLDQVDTPPVLKERVDPEYPASAANRKIEGFVIVNALISETGDVMEVVVVQGLAGGFNEKTVEAVRQWKYEPAVKDGQTVKVWKRITITFKTR